MARKVWSSAHTTAVTCDFRNLSSLRRAEFATLTAAFEEELQRRGIKIVAEDAPVTLILSVTQDPAEYIGVVQIRRKENTEAVMETIGPVNGPAAPEPAFGLTLHREFLFSQDSPILDVVLDNEGKRAEVLRKEEISFYELQGDRWVMTGSERLPTHRPPERAERGLIIPGAGSQAVYLSGELCRTSSGANSSDENGSGAKGWSCEQYTDQMPARTVSPGALAGKKLGKWVSVAELDTDGKARVVVTGEDGLARLYEDGTEPVAVFPNWGGEFASVYSGCGSGWQLLVSGKDDWTKPDEIQAIDIQERRTQPVSDPMEFSGPIVALRTPGTRSAANTTADFTANTEAVAVDRNLQTGRYEAYLLSIACSR
ncbi:MAG: hypothetical protein WBE13_09590 [Candidatus Acidiferrum sp.]